MFVEERCEVCDGVSDVGEPGLFGCGNERCVEEGCLFDVTGDIPGERAEVLQTLESGFDMPTGDLSITICGVLIVKNGEVAAHCVEQIN